MDSMNYDHILNQLLCELDREHPDKLRLRCIVKKSNCPYLKALILAKLSLSKKELPKN